MVLLIAIPQVVEIQMFKREDIITCWRYRDLADFIYEKATGLDNIPEGGIVWTPMNHIPDFFKRIEGTGRQYVVISSFCDYGIALQSEYPHWKDLALYAEMVGRQHGKEIGYNGINLPPRVTNGCKLEHTYSIRTYGYTHATIPCIPKEVKKWYLVNNMLPLGHDKRLINIPCGVQSGSEDRWTEQCDFGHKHIIDPRPTKFFLAWNDWTIERAELKAAFKNCARFFAAVAEKEISHDEFRHALKVTRFAICPEGIGVDCYRPLEALYCGNIPIVKHSPTIEGQNLPCIFYRDLRDILDEEYIDDSWISIIQAINKEPEVLNPIKFTYWKERIEEERKLLFGGFYNDDNE